MSVGLLLILALPVFSQSNDVIDDVLGQERARADDISYLVLVAAELIEEDASPEDAFAFAQERGHMVGEGPDAVVTLGKLSYLLMTSFDASGGIMYAIVPGPRYAARELVFQGLVPGRTDTVRELSGREALQIIERFLNWRAEG
jgi:hypothetical protein